MAKASKQTQVPLLPKKAPEISSSSPSRLSSRELELQYRELRPIFQRARYYEQEKQYERALKYYTKLTHWQARLLKHCPNHPLKHMLAIDLKLNLNQLKHLQSIRDEIRPLAPQRPFPPDSKLAQQEAEMRTQILRCIVQPDPAITWDDVKGLAHVKQAVEKIVFLPLSQSHLLRTSANMLRALFLFGPPGCGKTFLVKAIASRRELTVFSISAATLISKWQGESQKMVRMLYETAWAHAPSVIFIDEFDAMFGSASGQNQSVRSDSSYVNIQIQKELQQFMDGINTPAINETVTIVATNTPGRFNPAQLRRFDRILYVPPPDPETVEELVRHYLRALRHDLSPLEVRSMAFELRMFSPDEIRKIIGQLYYQAFCPREDIYGKQFPARNYLTYYDFHYREKNWRSSLRLAVPKEFSLQAYRDFYQEYGNPYVEVYPHYWEQASHERTIVNPYLKTITRNMFFQYNT